jgi:hypothetical protein
MNKEAILRAADWLEANPDKHIAGSLAIDVLGQRCSPTSPLAECFCALGRIALEANVDSPPGTRSYDTINRAVGLDKEQSMDIWRVNDRDLIPTNNVWPNGNPAVVAHLRRLAA